MYDIGLVYLQSQICDRKSYIGNPPFPLPCSPFAVSPLPACGYGSSSPIPTSTSLGLDPSGGPKIPASYS